MIETCFADIDRLSKEEIQSAYEILREAYATSEKVIWGENYFRILPDEFLAIIRKNQLIIAKIEGKIVGSIGVYPSGEGTYSFSLLSADAKMRGRGIGNKLVQEAECYAQKMGALKMTMEILRPRDVNIPVKTDLHNWYTRLGYRFLQTMEFTERFPDRVEKAKRLKVPSVFDCYEKNLIE